MATGLVEAFRARRPREFVPVSLGYRTVELIVPEQLEDAQLGYSVDPSGRPLAGFGDGDWSPSWLVIATEDETGDPIFVDISEPRWPVYTAAHGEGAWIPEPVGVRHPHALSECDMFCDEWLG